MQQNTQEWLDFRKGKIGASDASVIMGINPWKTRFQLWEEKLFGKEQEQTGAMKRGSFYEDEARSEFEKMTGISVMPKVIVSCDRTWQMASLDGLSFDGTVFTEIKVPNKEAHELAKEGIVAPHYHMQMQHQYATDSKLEKGIYFSYMPDQKEGIIVEVKRDDLLIEQMLEEEQKFYDCMVNVTAPELCERDYVVREDSLWAETAQEWLELSRYIKQLEESEEELRSKLIGLSNGHSTKGFGIRVTRSRPKGAIDYKNAGLALGIDFEPYRKPSSERWTLASCK